MVATLNVSTIQASGSSTPNITLDASGNATVGNTLAMGSSFKRNRIINGNMVIDQRNTGASVTPASGQYTLDRWNVEFSQNSKFSVQQNAGSVTPPAGFTNYLGATSLSAYTLGATDYFEIKQQIEGLNVADLAWGTANAKTVTLSFWVYSSLTGTFGACLINSAGTRTYAFSYSIPAANTWTNISVTIPGDTTGTWLKDNGVGIGLRFSIGVGTTYSGAGGAWSSTLQLSVTGAVSVVSTNGATWYVTGVQLEVGSVATPYERQIYSDQLAQCQRYYEKSYNVDVAPGTVTGSTFSEFFAVVGLGSYQMPGAYYRVTKRATPTVTVYSPATGAAGNVFAVLANADKAVNQEGNNANQFNLYPSLSANDLVRFNWAAVAEL